MKLNNTLKRLTWFAVGYLLTSTGVASYLHMMGIKTHWSGLILIFVASLGVAIVLFKDDIFQNETSSNSCQEGV
jgi:hypothetical protein